MDAYLGTDPWLPVARRHHDLAGALDAEMDVMLFGQLLAGQGRPEVVLVCADQLDGQPLRSLVQPAGLRLAALLADQPGQACRAVAPHPDRQPFADFLLVTTPAVSSSNICARFASF